MIRPNLHPEFEVGEPNLHGKRLVAFGFNGKHCHTERVDPFEYDALTRVIDRYLKTSGQKSNESKVERCRKNIHALCKSQQDSGRTFAGVDGSELASFLDHDVEWLVEDVFSADQPTIFGAASKATKTTQLVDLAVAMATETDWLQSFRIPQKQRILFITGESNERAISKRLNRALQVRGLGFESLKNQLRVEAVNFPNLPSIMDQETVSKTVEQYELDVVIVDPLYRGLRGLDAKQMTEVGDAIVSFAHSCRPASVIFSHHIVKSAARETRVPNLEDLTGAGFAESCGNWWLIGRNKPYAYDQQHDLTVAYGGRDEQSGLKRIEFNEREWTFDVTSGQDFEDIREADKESKRREREQTRINEAISEVKHVLRNQKQCRPKRWIEDRCKCPNVAVRKAISTLLDNGKLTEGDYEDSQNRKQIGLKLANRDVV